MSDPKKPPVLADDPDAVASADELREAEALRDALAEANGSHEGVRFAQAVQLAHAPRALEAAEHRAILEGALRSVGATARGGQPSSVRLGRFARIAAGGLALAAAVLVFARREPDRVAQTVPLEQARSADPLFHEPFPEHGGVSRRIDRIASARAADYRQNRFARWGAK